MWPRPRRRYELINCEDMAALSSGPLMGHQVMLQLTLWGAGRAGVSPLNRPLLKAPSSSLVASGPQHCHSAQSHPGLHGAEPAGREQLKSAASVG